MIAIANAGCAREKAKIDDLRPHDFRHARITLWAMEGKPVAAIMAASGHHSFEMHDRYANPGEKHLKEIFAVYE